MYAFPIAVSACITIAVLCIGLIVMVFRYHGIRAITAISSAIIFVICMSVIASLLSIAH